jgi:hypothetical protein
LAVNAIVNPHTIVPTFCTIKESVSPTMLFTAAASVERRAPIAPLQNPKTRLESCTPDSAAVGWLHNLKYTLKPAQKICFQKAKNLKSEIGIAKFTTLWE